MLSELLRYCTTPCSAEARRDGYLRESIAIEARHRRCRTAWQPHLRHCHAAMLEAAALCSRRNKLLILGSGALLDIPLEELAGMFAEIVLIDRVHPLHTRKPIRAWKHIRLLEADLGGVDPQPFPEQDTTDLIISANLLSQLPLIPVRHLQTVEAAALGRHIVETHLARLAASGAVTCLITDRSRRRMALDGTVVAEEDALFGVALPSVSHAWEWDIAPAPEIERDHHWRHQVVCVMNH